MPERIEDVEDFDLIESSDETGQDNEFRKLRFKEKFYSNILIGTIGFVLIAALAGYFGKETLAQPRDSYLGGYPSYSGQPVYTDYGSSAENGYFYASGGSGGCGMSGGSGGGCGSSGATGSSASGSSGGGCCGGGGAGGSLAAGVDFTELERQALAMFEQQKGSADNVTAKVGDFGCHIQVDIFDSTNTIVASYGYRGDSLYVIR